MSSLPLIHTQLVVPKIKDLLNRQRLYKMGLDILAHRITIIIAPAGYGKSVWVASLTDEKIWPATAWLSLDFHDADPSCLLYHLIHAIKMILPDFGDDPLRTLSSLESITRDWSIVANTIIEQIPNESELVIVLDDFHIVHENETVCAIVEYLIRWFPSNVHVVVISRLEPCLNIYQHELSGNLLEIGSQQLQFTLEETGEMLSLLELKMDLDDIASIHSFTEGWAAGLRMAGMIIRHSGGDVKKARMIFMRENSSLHQYLSRELLASLPQPLQDFFMDSSLLPYLEVKLCNVAFQRTDSSVLLDELHARGILSLVEAQPVTWRMHQLFREYLIERVKKQRTTGYIARIRKRACSYLEKVGDIDRAIEQAVDSAEWKKAGALINKYGYDYYMLSARQESLYNWIESLPLELVEADPRLLYYKGKSILHIDDKAAQELLSSAVDIANRNGDIKCEISCLLAMNNACLFTGDMDKGEVIKQRIISNPRFLNDPRSRGETLVITLGYAIFKDDLRQGLKLSRLVLRQKLNSELRMMALYGSAVIHHRLGNLIYARNLLEEALQMPFVQENERLAVNCYAILGMILTLLRDVPALEEIYYKMLKISHKYNMVTISGRAHRGMARTYWREGRFIEAQREYTQAYNCFVEGDNSFSVPTALELMLPRLRTGEHAQDLLQETIVLLNELERNPVGQGLDQVALAVAGIVAMEAGELDYARYLLENAATHWLQNGAKINQAGSNLLLAHVHLLMGNEKSADKLLKKALSLAEAGQWDNFWEWHHETIYTMCRRAMFKNIQINWAAHILSRWFPERYRKELGQLLLSANESLQTSALRYLTDFSQTSGTNVIHVFYLGGFRIFVNGQEVSPQNWKTRKAENLCKFLFANRGYHYKEEIIEYMWPDKSFKSGEASLRMALSHVRQALNIHSSRNDSIILNRGKVHLDPSLEIYVDYELFSVETQLSMQYAENNSPYTINTLEQALQLYGGDFLPSDFDEWMNNKRINLQNLYLRLLLKLTQLHYNKGNYSAALNLCWQYLSLDPVDEQIIRLAMQILRQSRNKRKALSLFHDLKKVLANDYNTVPEMETITLYKIICNEGRS